MITEHEFVKIVGYGFAVILFVMFIREFILDVFGEKLK